MNILRIFGRQWFYPEYWVWLFSDLKPFIKEYSIWWAAKVIFCRMREHPFGVVWYTSAMEPDTTCKNCGDETER